MENKKSAKEIKEEIINLIEQKELLSTGDTISFYDLSEACRIEFSCYSKYFNKTIKKNVKRLNNKAKFNNLFGNKLPYIAKVVPEVSNGQGIVTVEFFSDYAACGKMEIHSETEPAYLIDFNSNNFSLDSIRQFLFECQYSFTDFIKVLEYFNNSYETDYKWDPKKKDEKAILKVTDGFFEGKIDLDNPDNSVIGLKNVDDIVKADTNGIYDYVDFYNYGMQKRIGVDINSLPPLFNKIIDKHYNINNQRTLKR